MKPTKEYLFSLLQAANEKYENFRHSDIDLSTCDLSFMATKKQHFIGLRLGISEQVRMLEYKIHESNKLRSDCKFYYKIYRLNNQIKRIDNVVNGKEASSDWIAYYEKDYRYLFSVDKKGNKGHTYIFVTHFENGRVIEEYAVEGNQIVYERYDYINDERINYYYINYVPTGNEPVLGESSGYYEADTLEYVEEYGYVWYQDT